MTEFEKADIDGDGSISKQEMEIYLESKRREMEDEDAKRPEKLSRRIGAAREGLVDRVDVEDHDDQSDYPIFHGVSPVA